MFPSPQVYEFSIALIACAGAFIATLEWVSNWRQMQDDGLFSWPVFQTRGAHISPEFLEGFVNWLVSFRPFLFVLALRLVALIVLPLLFWSTQRGASAVLAIIFASSLLMHYRCPFGMDGSDQMSTQIFGALLLGQLSGSELGRNAALCYICAQTCLSYFTSGMAKAVSPHWRDGKIIFSIFNTRTYGYKPLASLLKGYPKVTGALGRSAVFAECVFPVSILAGFPGCLAFIAWGVAFHLMNAVVMGLNSFLWSFVATYPAVIYCAITVSVLVRHFFR